MGQTIMYIIARMDEPVKVNHMSRIKVSIAIIIETANIA